MSFKDFNFKDYIQEALDEIKFKEPTPVQQKLIPVVRSGRDLVGESKTGSGKTHTFLLPIFEKLNPESRDVQVVITAPSRELATQIYQSTKQIAKHSDTEIRVVNYVGGTDKQRQIEKLKVAQPHIVIGTPGRIYDLFKSGDLAIHKAHTFVVDEADMTMDMGFLATVDKIAASLPKEVQILVFSATIPQKLQPFLKKYLTNPVMEQIKTSTVIADTIDNWLVSTKGRNKNGQILEMLKGMQPYLAMIFVNTKERADDLHSYLVSNGLKVAKIHGGIPPRERKRIMNQVKKLDFEYIVELLQGFVDFLDQKDIEFNEAEFEHKLLELKEIVKDFAEDNPKLSDLLLQVLDEIEQDKAKFMGQDMSVIINQMRYTAIDKEIEKFSKKWYVPFEAVKYEAYNYKDGELANENKLKELADYATYKMEISEALPKF